jgi:hypothetical protein
VADKKCPIHGRKLERPARGAPSFSWATGCSSLENLDPIKPVTIASPGNGCDYVEDGKEWSVSGSVGPVGVLKKEGDVT